MVKLKNRHLPLKYFVLFLTFAAAVSCASRLSVSKIEGKQLNLNDKLPSSDAVEQMVKPYRDAIDKDLNTVLAYAPQTIDKSGKWQTPMGNLFADVARQYGSKVFLKREGRPINIVMLNHGGIRTIIPKGDVTTRAAYEIMPFENSMVVVSMTGTQLMDLINFMIADKKPHPLSGLTFAIDKDGFPKNIMIDGKPLDEGKTYFVGTNDYLYNGGDNMTFFKNGAAKYDLDYKLRNILIDYFRDVDTVTAATDVRITQTNP